MSYILNPGQEYALNAALTLGVPLLLTGEPGTGKTEMAKWALEYLQKKHGNYHPEVLRFNTKTTSKATDLLYSYDAVSHFQSANIKGQTGLPTAQFIELMPLGAAIALSNPKPEYKDYFSLSIPTDGKPLNSVVLIDEVDKAPRDFTNDLLNELERFHFSVKEQAGYAVNKGKDAHVVVILTSNSEKNLPDAFLRRCAFFHIEFPDPNRLRQIVQSHLGNVITDNTRAAYDELFAFFQQVREKSVRKKPATAELIGWLKLLSLQGFPAEKNAEARRAMLEQNLSFLVKTREDLEVIKKLL